MNQDCIDWGRAINTTVQEMDADSKNADMLMLSSLSPTLLLRLWYLMRVSFGAGI